MSYSFFCLLVSLLPPFHLCLLHSVTASELLCPFPFLLNWPHLIGATIMLFWATLMPLNSTDHGKILQLITPLSSPAPFCPFLFPFLFFFTHTSTRTLLNPAQWQRPVSRNYDKTQQLWLHKEGKKERKERGREVKRGEIEPLETWYLVWTSSPLWCCKWALHQGSQSKCMHLDLDVGWQKKKRSRE